MSDIFGPHVRRCVCDRCHSEFILRSKQLQVEWAAQEAALTPEQRANRDRFVSEVLAEVLADEKIRPPKVLPPGDAVCVGDRVRFLSLGHSSNDGRIGRVMGVPGQWYEERRAERFEILLDATADDEAETIWTSNDQYSCVKRIER